MSGIADQVASELSISELSRRAREPIVNASDYIQSQQLTALLTSLQRQAIDTAKMYKGIAHIARQARQNYLVCQARVPGKAMYNTVFADCHVRGATPKTDTPLDPER